MTRRVPTNIGSHPQLLLDDEFVERMTGLHRTMHGPVKHPRNPLIVPEQPFERRYKFHFGWGVGAVIRDPEAQLFRAYYPVTQKHLHYAESEDGITWRKPALGRAEYAGSRDNNILMPDCHAPSVIHHPDMPGDCPYRMFAVKQGVGPAVFRSRDGLNWSDPVPVKTPPGGDDACLTYDHHAHRFILTFKPRAPIGKTIVNPLTAEPWEIPIRHLVVSTSDDDMQSWSPWQRALVPDEVDQQSVSERYPPIFVEGFLYPWRMKPEFEAAHEYARRTGYLDRLTVAPQTGYHHMDFMNMVVIPYPGLYVGLLQVLNATAHTFDFGAGGVPRPDGGPGSDGTMEIQLVCSRDLVHWQRLGDRQPFLPLGEVGAWDQSMVTPFTSNGILRDGKHQLYYGGLRHSHAHMSRWNKPGDWPGERGGIGLATLRRDGFVSLDAGPEGGQFTTPLLRFTGENLVVNADARNGEIRVEVLDEDGTVVNGYSRNACRPVCGDDTDHVIHWQGTNGLGALQGRPISLRVTLRNAQLYSFFSGQRPGTW